MIEFVESPIFDNWLAKHYPEHSLTICSPYIGQDALDEIISLYGISDRIVSNDFSFKILLRGNIDEFTHGSSDITILNTLLTLANYDKNSVKRLQNLHMKAYLIDDSDLLITSGNLTRSGMYVMSQSENFEGGLCTDDKNTIGQFINYFNHIWRQGEAIFDFYDELMSQYNQYLLSEYSDKKSIDGINRQHYDFNKLSDKKLLKNSTSLIFHSSLAGIRKFHLDDLPPVGYLSYLDDTLSILDEFPNGLSYVDLGKILRSRYGLNDLNNDVNNRKFGEEKGKYASYFKLASIDDSIKPYLVKITPMGINYLRLSPSGKNNCIKKLFFSKPIVCAIIKQASLSNLNLKTFITTNCDDATPNTLDRRIDALKNLFDSVNTISDNSEMQSIINNIT